MSDSPIAGTRPKAKFNTVLIAASIRADAGSVGLET